MKKIKILLLAIIMLTIMLLPITSQAEQVEYCYCQGATMPIPKDIYVGRCIICTAPRYGCRANCVEIQYIPCTNGHVIYH